MARIYRGHSLQPSATGKRPVPIPPNIFADLCLIYATALDEESIILIPTEYTTDQFFGFDPDDENSRWRENSSGHRCQQATVAYERIGNNHPNLLPFLRRDPWTSFPILATPPGRSLEAFIEERKTTMYSAPLDIPSTRISQASLPMVYKWALDLISALAFIHSNDIIFGILKQDNCWISTARPDLESPHPSLSLFGFVDARFQNKPEEIHRYFYYGDWGNSPYYDDSVHGRNSDPTKHTDIFQYGCVLYELMVGVSEGTPCYNEVHGKVMDRQWTSLEIGTEYMDDIVRKCWKGEFAGAEEVKAEVEAFLQTYKR